MIQKKRFVFLHLNYRLEQKKKLGIQYIQTMYCILIINVFNNHEIYVHIIFMLKVAYKDYLQVFYMFTISKI